MIAAQTAGVPVVWLVARAAGLVAFGLLTVSVTLGLALSTRLLGNRRGKTLLGWHQTLMWTALAMLVLHMAARSRSTRSMSFGLVGVLVPGTAPSAAHAGHRRRRRRIAHARPRGLFPRPSAHRSSTPSTA